MPTKFQLITELYDQTVQSVTDSYQSWTGFLRAACYNYKCPFDDQILIYAQRPDATAVLEMERWNRQFGRWVNRGAKSIAVFGDDGQNCLKLYFDVSDTHASRFARPLPIWTMHPAFEPEVIETLEATFGNLAEKENLADAVRSACHNAVADNITDYLQDLRDCREDSLLEELDDLNLEVFYRDALEVSVAYMLMTRLGLPADEYFSPDEFAHVYEFNTPTTINALAVADCLEQREIPVRVQTAIEMKSIAEPYIRGKAIAHLERGRVVIFGCGTGNPYFSTDTGAVLRGVEIGADAILLAKNVDGVYSADPAKDPTAQRYDHLTYDEVLARHLQATDTTAMTLAMDNQMPIIVFELKDPQNILRVVQGEKIGTIIKED